MSISKKAARVFVSNGAVTKGSVVTISKGAVIRFFSGSVLDKKSVKESRLEYTAVGVVTDVSPNRISVDSWSGDSEGGAGILNIPRGCFPWIALSGIALSIDPQFGVQQVFHPLDLPSNGSRQYRIDVQYETKNSFQKIAWTTWALSRKQALTAAKSGIPQGEELVSVRIGAKLKWKGQKPFSRAAFLERAIFNEKPAFLQSQKAFRRSAMARRKSASSAKSTALRCNS